MSKATELCADNYFSPCGSKTKIKHILKVDPDGSRYLVEDGVVEVYDQIQSFKDSCDIETIIKRVQAGESDLLNMNPGIYTDVAAIPEDLISSYKAFDRASEYYRELPADIRTKFGSFEKFLEAFAYGAYVTDQATAPATAPATEGVKNNEQVES